MKQAESTPGVPLAGLAVEVTPGFYRIGLSNLDADKERHLQLLKERGWFDMPVVYSNNRRAILAMEKGTPGGCGLVITTALLVVEYLLIDLGYAGPHVFVPGVVAISVIGIGLGVAGLRADRRNRGEDQ